MPALPWWFLAVFVVGANFAIWGTIGIIRLAETRTGRLARRRAGEIVRPVASRVAVPKRRARKRGSKRRRNNSAPGRRRPGTATTRSTRRKGSLDVKDVAVLMPAHNEAAVLGASLDAIMKLVPARNIHVVSDGSTDDTAAIARQAGVRVHETESNVGKAGALQDAIQRFKLIRRYPVVMLLDADTRIEPGYFSAALPLFQHPDVVAVAGCVRTARDRQLSVVGNILVGHRERIYAIGQRLLKFGQTYLRTNATHIVPGFASMYRTKVLPFIELNPPGLVIEDFNMTFEVYQKGLGKVAFTLSAVAVTQDPDRFRDYVKQTRRWSVGLWQTVRRHPPRPNLFSVMLALLLLELIASSVIFVLLPLLLVVLLLPDLAPVTLAWPAFAGLHTVVAAHVTLSAVAFGVVLPDYALTCVVAVLDRRARLLFVGLFFPFLRVVDAVIALSAVPAGWLVRSSGIWQSPRPQSRCPQSRRPPALQATRQPVPPNLNLPRRGRVAPNHPLRPIILGNAVMHLDEPALVQSRQASAMNPIRVLLADDHLMITEALASRLSAVPDIWVAGRCGATDPNLLAIVRGVRPDVIALEAEPFGSGVGDMIERLSALSPQARVVILTADRNVAHAVAAAKAGAAAWVAKEQDATEFEAVIHGVCRGYSWFPPEMLGEILRSLRADASRDASDLDALSSREVQVLRAMMTGRRGRQIASDLHISADTVRTHTQNIYAKLEVHSRLEAVSMARAAGLEPFEGNGSA